MPIESVDFVTYYNIFEYAYPVCLLTVAATLVYIGFGLWKSNELLLLPTRLTTFLFGLFLLPTFLHAVNHITDTIVNTTQNNALNWFGLIGIPITLIVCWFGMPGQMVFGRSAEVTKQALMRVLEKHKISYEAKGRTRLRTSIGTFVVAPVAVRPIVLVYAWPSHGGSNKQLFADLEAMLRETVSDSKGNSVRGAAFATLSCGFILGTFSFISWATSILMISPNWRSWL